MSFFVRVMVRVKTTQLPDSKDVYMSIRVRARVTITQFPEIKVGKIDVGKVGECKE